MKLYPAILTDSLHVCQQQLDLAAAESEIDTVQIDVIDGFFADNVTVTPLDLVNVEFGSLQADLHLMTDEPLDFVFEAVPIKQLVPIRAVIAQVEHMSFQQAFVEEVRLQGWKPGLSLDLFTPVEAIEAESWADLAVVQVMGIEAGYQGTPFHANAIEKIKELVDLRVRHGYTFELIVDGGVTADLLPQLQQLGVEGVAMGSAIWEASSPAETLREVRQLAHSL